MSDHVPDQVPLTHDGFVYCGACGSAMALEQALKAYCDENGLELVTRESWRTMVADTEQARRYRHLPESLRTLFG